MSAFSFLNPGFLWALPAAAIPILIHILSRRRLPEVGFPSVMFLRALEPREIRRLKLRELLLLVLRTLAVVLLVCAFARPSIEPPGATTRAAASIAIVVDDSESMGALDEQARPRFESARERALAIVDAARPGDEIAVTATTDPDAPLVNRSGDRLRLGRTVRQINSKWVPGAMQTTLRRARRFLGKSALPTRELYVISDFQRSDFTAAAMAELALVTRMGAKVYPVPVVAGRVPNHSFEGLDSELRPGPQGRGLELRARLANHADSPSDRVAIRVRQGDALIGGGDVTLGAEESRWAAMAIEWRGAAGASGPEGSASPAAVIAESDVDALPADDRWFAVLGPPRKLRVLRITESRGGAPAPKFSALALDPAGDRSSGFAVEEGTPASLLTLSKSRCEVVLLEDITALSGDAEARLRSFLRAGGGLVLALGQHADPDYYSHRLFPGIVDLAVEGIERAAEGQAFELKVRAPGHAILDGFSVGVGSALSQARLTGLHRGRALTARAEVVVTTGGGLPVVVAAPQVAVFLSSLADDWGDIPYSGAYVPLVRGLVDHAARAGAGAAIDRPTVGRPPSAHLDAAPSGALTVRGPDSYHSQASVIADGTGFRAIADAPAAAPGFYVFASGERELAVQAVNVDPVESDLAPIPVDSLARAGEEASRPLATLGSLQTHLRETRQGRELWLPFLLASALFFAAELTVGSARLLKP